MSGIVWPWEIAERAAEREAWAHRLKAQRLLLGMTQREFGEMLEVKYENIYRWERGDPTLQRWLKELIVEWESEP